jgi:Tfp pilus assembly protein PilO
MKPNLRIWGLVSGAAIVAVLAGGWFVGVQPQLAAAETSTQTAVGQEAQNQATRAKLAGLVRAAAKVDAMTAENAVLLKSVPTILKPNTFIRRVSEVAALDGVTVMSVSPGTAVAYTAPAPVAPAPGMPAAPALAATSPAITAANFTVVPVSLIVTGSADSALQFAHDIQNDERTFAVTGYQTAKAEDSSDVTATLTGSIYTLKR